MAFKLVIIAACLAYANAGYLQAAAPVLSYSSAADVSHVYNSYHAAPYAQYADAHLAHGVQSQNILRSHGGTVSQISKSVVSPHSHVNKIDTRVNNQGYKTLSYAPAVQTYAAPLAYAHHQPTVYAHQQPAYYNAHHQPSVYSHHQPAQVLVSYSSPLATYGW